MMCQSEKCLIAVLFWNRLLTSALPAYFFAFQGVAMCWKNGLFPFPLTGKSTQANRGCELRHDLRRRFHYLATPLTDLQPLFSIIF